MSKRIKLAKGSAKKIMTQTRWIALRKRWKEIPFSSGGRGGLRSHLGSGLVETLMFGLRGASVVAMHVASHHEHARHGAAPHEEDTHERDAGRGQLASPTIEPHANRGGENSDGEERGGGAESESEHGGGAGDCRTGGHGLEKSGVDQAARQQAEREAEEESVARTGRREQLSGTPQKY